MYSLDCSENAPRSQNLMEFGLVVDVSQTVKPNQSHRHSSWSRMRGPGPERFIRCVLFDLVVPFSYSIILTSVCS